ncbi:MAG: 2Fe-2S iron-sulfur cluster-binding protein [Oscillospiraceae bacterium]
MVTLTIDGQTVSGAGGDHHSGGRQSSAGIHIPTLCYLKDINEIAACRMCMVEVEGAAPW